MSSIIDVIGHYQRSIEKSAHDEARLLHCIEKLYKLPVTVDHLQQTGIGKTVNSLRKYDKEVGVAAKALVAKWKAMVAAEEELAEENMHKESCEEDEPPPDNSDDDGTMNHNNFPTYNGHDSRHKENNDLETNHRELSHDVRVKEEATNRQHTRNLSEDLKKVRSNHKSSSGSNKHHREKSRSSKDHHRYKKEPVETPPYVSEDNPYENEGSSSYHRDPHDRRDAEKSRSSKDHRIKKEPIEAPPDIPEDFDRNDGSNKYHQLDQQDRRNEEKSQYRIKKEFIEAPPDIPEDHYENDVSNKYHREFLDRHDKQNEEKSRSSKDYRPIKKEPTEMPPDMSEENPYDDNGSTNNDYEDDEEKLIIDINNKIKQEDSVIIKSESSKSIHDSRKTSSRMSSKEHHNEFSSSSHRSQKNKSNDSDSKKSSSSRKHNRNSDKTSDSGDRHRHKTIKKESEKNSHRSNDEHKSSKRKNNETHSRSNDADRKDTSSVSSKNSNRNESSNKINSSSNNSGSSSKNKSSKRKHDSAYDSNSEELDSEQSSPKKLKPNPKVVVDSIDSSTGHFSFEEALGMITGPASSSKMSTKLKSPKANGVASATATSSRQQNKVAVASSSTSSSRSKTPPLLTSKIKLEPLDLKLALDLPTISPNYKPMPLNQTVMDCVFSAGGKIQPQPQPQKRYMTDDEALQNGISSKTMRTKIYSGMKTGSVLQVPTLFDLCIRVLQKNIDGLEYTGGVPYNVLKPILERATPQQLATFEEYNPYLLEDTDELWEQHCNRRYKAKKRNEEEMESWREMFLRCKHDEEERFNSITKNISYQQKQVALPVRRTQLAYIDAAVKPPRNVLRKQEQFGTKGKFSATPAARVESLAKMTPTIAKVGDSRLRVAPDTRDFAQASANNRPKKAPLMQKSLQLMKGRFKR